MGAEVKVWGGGGRGRLGQPGMEGSCCCHALLERQQQVADLCGQAKGKKGEGKEGNTKVGVVLHKRSCYYLPRTA